METFAEEMLNKGLKQGRQDGRQERQTAILSRLLRRKLGEEALTPEVLANVAKLSEDDCDQLSEDLLDFQTVDDLQRWFAVRSN